MFSPVATMDRAIPLAPETAATKNDVATAAAFLDVTLRLVFLISASITFTVYVSTASNSISGGDSGELAAEGCQLGTAHPPGYPLYTIIVGIVVRIAARLDLSWFKQDAMPPQSPAYWINVASCFFGCIAAGLISSIIFKLTQGSKNDVTISSLLLRSACAISTSMMWAFTKLNWQYNKEAEVFALHNLFVAAILYVLTIYGEKIASIKTNISTKAGRDQSDERIVVIGAFICGLSLTNQHTSILLIIPVAAHVFHQSCIFEKPKLLLASVVAFLVGLSPYIALPILATIRPHAGSWGNVISISGFIHHLLRRDYGTLQLFSGDDSGSEGMMSRTASWAHDFVFDQLCHPLVAGFVLLGVVDQMRGLFRSHKSTFKTNARHAKKKPKQKITANPKPSNGTGRVIIYSLVFYLGVFHSLSNLPLSNPLLYGIHQRFWMHPNILAFILLGVGMHSFVATTSRLPEPLTVVLSITTLLLPTIQYHSNIDVSDQHSNSYFRNYATAILDTLPSNSLLLINYDQQWTSIRYIQECEGVRNDVTSINLSMMTYPWWKSKHTNYPHIDFPGTHYSPWVDGGFTFTQLIDSNIDAFDGNIFIGGKINYDDRLFNTQYEEVPHGLVRRIEARNKASVHPVEAYRQDSLKTWTIVSNHLASNLPSSTKYPSSTWEWTITREFFDHMISRSTYLLDMALNNNDGTQQVLPSIAEAAAWLELASSWDTEGNHKVSPSMKKNLGLAYMNIVRSSEENFPIVADIFNAKEQHRRKWWSVGHSGKDDNDESWKAWATVRWKEEWGSFLALDSAKAEPGYGQVKAIYEAVMASSRGNIDSK